MHAVMHLGTIFMLNAISSTIVLYIFIDECIAFVSMSGPEVHLLAVA